MKPLSLLLAAAALILCWTGCRPVETPDVFSDEWSDGSSDRLSDGSSNGSSDGSSDVLPFRKRVDESLRLPTSPRWTAEEAEQLIIHDETARFLAGKIQDCLWTSVPAMEDFPSITAVQNPADFQAIAILNTPAISFDEIPADGALENVVPDAALSDLLRRLREENVRWEYMAYLDDVDAVLLSLFGDGNPALFRYGTLITPGDDMELSLRFFVEESAGVVYYSLDDLPLRDVPQLLSYEETEDGYVCEAVLLSPSPRTDDASPYYLSLSERDRVPITAENLYQYLDYLNHYRFTFQKTAGGLVLSAMETVGEVLNSAACQMLMPDDPVAADLAARIRPLLWNTVHLMEDFDDSTEVEDPRPFLLASLLQASYRSRESLPSPKEADNDLDRQRYASMRAVWDALSSDGGSSLVLYDLAEAETLGRALFGTKNESLWRFDNELRLEALSWLKIQRAEGTSFATCGVSYAYRTGIPQIVTYQEFPDRVICEAVILPAMNPVVFPTGEKVWMNAETLPAHMDAFNRYRYVFETDPELGSMVLAALHTVHRGIL